MKRFFFLFLLGTTCVYGQRNFTIDETVYGPGKFAPKTIQGAQWTPSSSLSHLDETGQHLALRSSQDNWKVQNIIALGDLQKALTAVLPGESIVMRRLPAQYKWLNETTIVFDIATEKKAYKINYDYIGKKASAENLGSTTGNNIERAKDNKLIAYLVGNNIEIEDRGVVTKVTNDTVNGVVNGSDYTHRQEFGINKGMWWSPDNKSLLYYRKDETMVTRYPLPQWDTRVASVVDIRYPMAGMKSEEVSLVVYNLDTKSYVTLQTGEPKEQYLTIVTWDPTGEYIYTGVLNRGQDHLKLNQYNAKTGTFVKTLFEEKSTTWVEPQHALIFLPNNSKQFLYQTDRDGFNQFYLYDTSGKLIKKLGFNDVIVSEFERFDAKGQKLYYTGVSNKGMDKHLYEVDIKSGKTIKLTSVSGTHSASLSPNGAFLYDQYSNLTIPNRIEISHTKTKSTQTLLEAANPFVDVIDLPKIEFKEFLSADGKTPLNARITYPTNFDPTKKYPVMVYLYGGSHAQLVTNRWLGGIGYFDLYMAQNGYLVFTLDNRGSDNRGYDFTRVTHRQLGEAEIADQLVGVDYLKSLPYVDASKMGIFGWSYGGYMTTSMMTKHNTTFVAGVAGGPVMDWKYYEIMYGERYMDSPQENPDGYSKTSLLNKASKLNGHLLIIHGAQDPVVVQQHSMDFVEHCIKAGKQIDYFLYPKHEHNVFGQDRIHMYDKIAKYFDLYLK